MTTSDGSALATRGLIVGTRGSALAQWQTDFVVAALKRLVPDLSIERQIIKTAGDKDQNRPLAEIGGLGVFTKEIENALIAHEIDIAVHSLKDLPTETTTGLTIAAIMAREDPRDCVISRHGVGLMQLARGARVGTSSARRGAQVLALRRDLLIVPLRGNVDTRLRKARTEEYDAIVIAAAGLIRLGRSNEITEYLPLDEMVPDPGQGALAVEIRSDDEQVASLVSELDHAATHAAATAERSFLQQLGGGCRMPIGAFAEMSMNTLKLRGVIASLDGRRIIRGDSNAEPARASHLGIHLANQLLSEGGAEILGLTEAQDIQLPTPLRGRRILVTRAREQASGLANKIKALGGEPVEFPVIDYAPLEDFEELDAAIACAPEFDWIVFTSANGVRATGERLAALGMSPLILSKVKLAAIGPATRRALSQLGLTADFVPTKFLGQQIAVELPIQEGQSALLLRADLASEELAGALAARGVRVTDVDAYRTIMPVAHAVELRDIDAVTFTSSSTVRNLHAMLNEHQRQTLAGLAVFCIGPVTARTAQEMGLPVAAVASEHTVEGLVSALVGYYRDGRPERQGPMEEIADAARPS